MMLTSFLIILWVVVVFVCMCIHEYRQEMQKGNPELLEIMKQLKRERSELKQAIKEAVNQSPTDEGWKKDWTIEQSKTERQQTMPTAIDPFDDMRESVEEAPSVAAMYSGNECTEFQDYVREYHRQVLYVNIGKYKDVPTKQLNKDATLKVVMVALEAMNYRVTPANLAKLL